MREYRVLTIRQPWADLVIRGLKPVENRLWKTEHRGPLIVHAGLGFDVYATRHTHVRAAYRGRQVVRRTPGLTYGTILGVVDLTDCHEAQPTRPCCSPWGEQPSRDGQTLYHLALANPRALPEPVQATGAQRLVRPHPDLLQRVLDALEPEAAHGS